MAKEHLSLKPHHPTKRGDVWWYEDNDGIFILMENPSKKTHGVVNTCKIKWSSLRAALARKDRKAKRGK